MKWISIGIFLVISTRAGAQEAACNAIVPPAHSDSMRKVYEQKWLLAKTDYEKDTMNADAITWYGRRTAYLGNYMQAIAIFQKPFHSIPTMPVCTATAAIGISPYVVLIKPLQI